MQCIFANCESARSSELILFNTFFPKQSTMKWIDGGFIRVNAARTLWMSYQTLRQQQGRDGAFFQT